MSGFPMVRALETELLLTCLAGNNRLLWMANDGKSAVRCRAEAQVGICLQRCNDKVLFKLAVQFLGDEARHLLRRKRGGALLLWAPNRHGAVLNLVRNILNCTESAHAMSTLCREYAWCSFSKGEKANWALEALTGRISGPFCLAPKSYSVRCLRLRHIICAARLGQHGLQQTFAILSGCPYLLPDGSILSPLRPCPHASII
mmetsp:Transcript_6587/g.19958  ORF Transcript_6587/g.19958 Transcript_6587/m.19958 type:complete len:202 (+) Transcript_6587:785-1390(+)